MNCLFPLPLHDIYTPIMPMALDELGAYVLLTWLQVSNLREEYTEEECQIILKVSSQEIDWLNLKRSLIVAGFNENEKGLYNPLVIPIIQQRKAANTLCHIPRKKRFIEHWQDIRKRIIERDGGICVYCGASEKGMHVDHIIPLSRGGTNEDSNLVTACPSCNVSKQAQTESEWLS